MFNFTAKIKACMIVVHLKIIVKIISVLYRSSNICDAFLSSTNLLLLFLFLRDILPRAYILGI